MMIFFEFLKGLAIALFFIGSVFVFLYGRPKSGIKLDYFISCIILIIIMWRLST